MKDLVYTIDLIFSMYEKCLRRLRSMECMCTSIHIKTCGPAGREGMERPSGRSSALGFRFNIFNVLEQRSVHKPMGALPKLSRK